MTKAIKTLEAEFGLSLLHRWPQVRLPEWGERIWPVFEMIDAAVAEVRSLAVAMKSAEHKDRAMPRNVGGDVNTPLAARRSQYRNDAATTQ